MASLRTSGLLAAGLALGGTVHAQGQALWEVGAVGFGVSQQAYPGAGQQVNRALALPFVIYRGRYLRADRDTAGLRALKTPQFELDLGFAGAFAARSVAIDARRGMPDLGTLVEAGPRLTWNLSGGPDEPRWRLELPLRGVFDLDDRAAHRGTSFEPRLVYSQRADGGGSRSVSVAAIVADRRLARTLYEVAPAYALPDRAAYEARGGLVAWRLAGSITHPITSDWLLFGFARIDALAGAANRDSPLVRRSTGATLGLGMSYTWMRSQRRAED
jgi:outer membrane scaffolding protein for murein synthesis (MipA/OmpV family)